MTKPRTLRMRMRGFRSGLFGCQVGSSRSITSSVGCHHHRIVLPPVPLFDLTQLLMPDGWARMQGQTPRALLGLVISELARVSDLALDTLRLVLGIGPDLSLTARPTVYRRSCRWVADPNRRDRADRKWIRSLPGNLRVATRQEGHVRGALFRRVRRGTCRLETRRMYDRRVQTWTSRRVAQRGSHCNVVIGEPASYPFRYHPHFSNIRVIRVRGH